MDRQEVTSLLERQRQKLERAIGELSELRASLPDKERLQVDRTLRGLRECLAEDLEYFERWRP